MVKSGYAKGANAGHITQERTLKPKPSCRKGVRVERSLSNVPCRNVSQIPSPSAVMMMIFVTV